MRNYSELIRSKTQAIKIAKVETPLEKIFHNVHASSGNLVSQLSEQTGLSIILELNSEQTVSEIGANFPGLIAVSMENPAKPVAHGDTPPPTFGASGQPLSKIHNDLILEPYQIYQSRFLGFNLLPLYIGSLEESQVLSLFLLARQLGMGTIFSVSSQKELEKAVASPAKLIGIHEVDYFGKNLKVEQICELAEEVPQEKLILTRLSEPRVQDLEALKEAEINAVILPCPETPRKLSHLKRKLSETIS
jgi:hypothetical protein